MSTYSFDTYTDRHETLALDQRVSGETLRETLPSQAETILKELNRRSDITTPSSSSTYPRTRSGLTIPSSMSAPSPRVETKSNVNAAVASTAISAVSVLIGAGPQWGGARDFIHYCSRCGRKVAVKYHSKGNADVCV